MASKATKTAVTNRLKGAIRGAIINMVPEAQLQPDENGKSSVFLTLGDTKLEIKIIVKRDDPFKKEE